ncbi:MAG: DNA polymerase IV [Myxococcota bacterium]|nr:DNA polymerase IV [Myxococcota bacterium]
MTPSHASPRVIVHADMDAFYAQIEQLDEPNLRNKAIAVGGLGERAVVATASYEARRFGIRSAMPMVIARRKCPDLIVVPPRFDRYKAVSKIIMDVFEDFSSPIEPLSLDEAFLDVTETFARFSGPNELGQTIKESVRGATGGLTVSVGIGNSKLIAKLASDMDKPDGLTIVPPECVQQFLDPLPVRRLWGVGPKTAERLEAAGFKTFSDLARANQAALAPLGRQARLLNELARGIDHRPVKPRGRPKSIGWERTLEHDVTTLEEIKPILRHGAKALETRLRHRRMVALGLKLKAKTSRFQVMSRQRIAHGPIVSAEAIYKIMLELLTSLPSGTRYRLFGVSAFSLEAEGTGRQLELPLQSQRGLPVESSGHREERKWTS